jgi:phospholipid/cholesterol/gamma-HCH transport system ATP-binding protein
MSESAIEVESLRAAYGEEVVLDGVSFSVARGEIVTILGGSGCGKTTLLRNMIGLENPAAGRVLIGGRDLCATSGVDRLEVLRLFGVMFQSGALFGSMTLSENIELALAEFTDLPGEARRAVARLKLDLVGLGDAAWKLPSEVSGGMSRRAAIARAMALDPGILFLDEPSAGLDPVTSAEIDALVLQLRGTLGVTFVLVTHELASIFAIADRALMLDKSDKGIIAQGTPAELGGKSSDPRVHAFFNREIPRS